MTDENGSNTPNTGTSPEQHLIPKHRLDEEIAAKRQLEQQLQFANQLLQQQVMNRPQAQPQPRPEPAYMKKLKEENEAAYFAIKKQEEDSKRLAASQYETHQELDRMRFLNEFGESGKKFLPEVERKLQELQRAGNFHYNRAQILLHLRGLESIEQERKQAARPQVQTQTVPQTQEVSDAPPSRASAVDVLRPGSVPSQQTSAKTIEQMEAELENIEF